MQLPTAPPRESLTEAAVVGLIRDAPAVEMAAGLELLDADLHVIDDVTDDFGGGSVARNGYATLHGTAQLGVARTLDWGRAIVRPYMSMTDATTTARFNLGAYVTSTPKRVIGQSPPMHAVAGYDILHTLATPAGEAYAVDAGVGYLAAVETILTNRGYVGYVIDQSAAASMLPSSRVWPLDQGTTWLNIVNDLLGAVAYQGIWSDWDGRLRVQRYLSPIARAPEWYYDVDPVRSMLDSLRTVERDFFEAPNRWVAVRANNIDGPAPVEGDGIFTYVNQFVGDTSVEARGRIISKVVPLEAADHAALVAAAQITIDADMRIPTKLSHATFPNPLHWHFDRLVLTDAELGPAADVLSTQWTLPLNGANQTHEWTVLSQ